jgi:hypothetical protein
MKAMKNEMMKFVDENFELLKSNYYQIENDIQNELDESDEEIEEMNQSLDEQMSEINSSLDLIELINERGIGIDIDNEDECEELLIEIQNMIF